MLHRGLDFHIVRVVCHQCGWERKIAHSGCADGKRAIVRIQRSNDSSHVLEADIIEISQDIPADEWTMQHPGFRDLVAEAHEKGLHAAMREHSGLFEGQSCPRCKQSGELELEQSWNLGQHADY